MPPVHVSCPLGPECRCCQEEKRQRYIDLDKLVEAAGDVCWVYDELKDTQHDPEQRGDLEVQFAQAMKALEARYQQVS